MIEEQDREMARQAAHLFGGNGLSELQQIELVAAELAKRRSVLPKINIVCETRDGGVIGSTCLNVIRVEQEDDGSLTAVTDFWPQ